MITVQNRTYDSKRDMPWLESHKIVKDWYLKKKELIPVDKDGHGNILPYNLN